MDDATEWPLAGPEPAPGLADLIALCGEGFDPLFWPSARPRLASAWYGHVPFGHWLVSTTRPGCIVELGTHSGVSYAAFCEAVLRSGLATRCFAVDTWSGDPLMGFYGEAVFEDFRAFHDSTYAAFSTIMRGTFDAAVERFAPGSIDLLHIDGLHTYEAVRHDFETWRPKLSRRGVVLFHDIAVQGGGFGVHRLWAELRPAFPTFTFDHSFGLGVLAAGEAAPPSVAALCRLAEPDAARVRARFARLGEPHELRHVLARHGIAV